MEKECRHIMAAFAAASLLAAAALPLLCSCERAREQETDGTSYLSVTVRAAGAADSPGRSAASTSTSSSASTTFFSATKSWTAPAYTELLPCESRVNTLRVCAYSSATGELLDSWPLLTDVQGLIEAGGGSLCPARTLKVRPGEVTVCAVANAPAPPDISSLEALRDTRADLGAGTVTGPDGAFVLYGETQVEAEAGQWQNIGLTLRRLCARVALAQVENLVPESMGTVVLESFFLANAVGGGVRLGDGSVPSPQWLNRRGRRDETPLVQDHVIRASPDAQLPSLTWSAQGQTLSSGVNVIASPAVLYCAANSSTEEPDGFAPSWPAWGQKTVAVACISIGGRLYRCPVTLPCVNPDTAYTVSLSVSGPAGSEPNGYPAKGYVELGVTLSPFTPGGTYSRDM